MTVNRLYNTLFERLQQMRPTERKTRLANMAWLIAGIYQSGAVHLSKIADKIASLAKLPSKVRRLERFLDNGAVRVREWYEPVAKQIIEQASQIGEIRLIVDGTKVGFGHQLLMVAVAYRRRALPVVWTWVRSKRGHSSAHKHLALLSYVHGLIPKGCQVLIVGDSEFGSGEVIKQLKIWKWRYALRQQPNWLVQVGQASKRLDSLVLKSGQHCWLQTVPLTQKHALITNLLAYWKPGEKQAWLLATNLPTVQATLVAYRRRMWIEEMFGDFKGHGFDLESTHLRHFLRISRLTLAVALLYVWLVAWGSQIIKDGLRHLVDRKAFPNFSIFRIGCNMLERCLSNRLAFNIRLRWYHPSKVSAS